MAGRNQQGARTFDFGEGLAVIKETRELFQLKSDSEAVRMIVSEWSNHLLRFKVQRLGQELAAADDSALRGIGKSLLKMASAPELDGASTPARAA